MTNPNPRLEEFDFTPQPTVRKGVEQPRDKYGIKKALSLAVENPGRWVTAPMPTPSVARHQTTWARTKGADLGVEVKARGENVHIRVPASAEVGK